MSEDVQWTKVIRPYRGWFNLELRALWQYRDLIFLFVWRDFVKVYKQTVLGPLWYILQPLFTTLVFTVIFGRVINISTDGQPHILFYMSGIVVWSYFASCLLNTSTTFVENAGIFGKVYFPRLTVPISIVLSKLITFSLQLLFFIATLLYFSSFKGYSLNFTSWVAYVPVFIIHMAALGLGLGIIVSSLTAKYRDLGFLTGFGINLWMYATPIVYPLSAVPSQFKWLIVINPMTPIVEVFRHAFLGSGTVHLQQLGISLVITLGILLLGILLFSRIEKSFMDTV